MLSPLTEVTRMADETERDGGEAEARGGDREEVVAVRIFDQVLPRVLDCGFVRALAAKIVRQIERSDDLIEELRVAFGGLGHTGSIISFGLNRRRRAPEQS